jgi:hypothetical protein
VVGAGSGRHGRLRQGPSTVTAPALSALAKARAGADLLIAYLRSTGLDLDVLAENPAGVLEEAGLMTVEMVAPQSLPRGCSIAAWVDRSVSPPHARVSADASPGRRAFSTLHEFGQVLVEQVADLVRLLLAERDRGRKLEEQICDVFSAHILLSGHARDAFADGVAARDVAALFQHSRGSREACAVAAAEHLNSPGLVMVARSVSSAGDRDASLAGTAGPGLVSTFAAAHGDEFRVARGTFQDADVLRTAWSAGSGRGQGQPRYASGVHGRDLLVDAVRDGDYLFAVWVTDSPPWGGLTVLPRRGVEGVDGYCEDCGQSFTSYAAPCGACRVSKCPTCGRCECDAQHAPTKGERMCTRCFTVLPANCFEGDNDICNEH